MDPEESADADWELDRARERRDGTLAGYRIFCADRRLEPSAHDSVALWLRWLVLPRHQLVAAAEGVGRRLYGDGAPALLDSLDALGLLGEP
jgi:hypothetical protein